MKYTFSLKNNKKLLTVYYFFLIVFLRYKRRVISENQQGWYISPMGFIWRISDPIFLIFFFIKFPTDIQLFESNS